MLSSDERRALDAIEDQLRQEDPKLAAKLSGRRLRVRVHTAAAGIVARLSRRSVGLPLVLLIVGIMFLALAAVLAGSGTAVAALATGVVVAFTGVLLAFRHEGHR